MASKKSIGATLVLNVGNFFTNVRTASESVNGLKGKLQSLVGQNSKTANSNKAMETSFGSVTKKILGTAAAAVSLNAVKGFVTDCVTGVMELERANTRLETLMMNVSGTTKEQVKDLIDYGDQLELITTIESDATMAGASQLATFQLQSGTIKTLLPAFQDLAVAQYGVNVSQDQMIQSANLIGKVMGGSTGALKKAGVTFTEAQEKILKTGTETQKAATLVEVLGVNFGGLAQEMAKTDEGKIRQLKNAWGSVKDEIGFAVMPAISNVVTYLNDHIPQIRDTVTNAINAVSPHVENVVGTIVNVGGKAVNILMWTAQHWRGIATAIAPVLVAIGAYKTMVGIMNVLENICRITTKLSVGEMRKMSGAELAAAAAKGVHTTATGLLSSATATLNALFVASPIGWIVLGIAAAVAAFILLYRHCEGFRNLLGTVWSGIKAFGSGCVEVFKKIGGFIGSVFGKAKDVISERLAGMKQAYEEHGGGVKGFFAGWWEGIKGYYTAGFSFIDKLTGGKLTAIKDKFVEIGTGVLDHIKGVINKITGAINILIRGINKVKFELPDWVPGGPKTLGFNIPEIPQLAKGGIIRRPGTVMVGERGPEYLNLPTGAQVTPLEKANNSENVFNIYINGVNKTVDEILDDLVPRLKLALSNL